MKRATPDRIGGLSVISSETDIPDFATESEEAAFWETHTVSDEMLDATCAADPGLPRSGAQTGTRLSLPAGLSERLRAAARQEGVSYLDLAIRLLEERLTVLENTQRQ